MQSEYILIDSNKAIKRYKGDSDFVFRAGRKFLNVKKVELEYCSFNNMFHNIHEYFIVSYRMTNGGQTSNYSFKLYNYNVSIETLRAYLQTQFITYSSAFSNATVTYDTTNRKFTFNSDNTFAWNYTDLFPYKILGFDPDDGFDYALENSKTSFDVIRLDGPPYIMINIHEVGTNVNSVTSAGTFFIPILNGEYESLNTYFSYQFKQVIETNNIELGDIQITIQDHNDMTTNIWRDLNLRMLVKVYY